jgi:CRISPR/Cas system-associated exonuclease Cas4 (RecB family)
MRNMYYVTASEIGDYVFCKRGWWLRFNGLLKDTEAMTKGVEQHEKNCQ